MRMRRGGDATTPPFNATTSPSSSLAFTDHRVCRFFAPLPPWHGGSDRHSFQAVHLEPRDVLNLSVIFIDGVVSMPSAATLLQLWFQVQPPPPVFSAFSGAAPLLLSCEETILCRSVSGNGAVVAGSVGLRHSSSQHAVEVVFWCADKKGLLLQQVQYRWWSVGDVVERTARSRSSLLRVQGTTGPYTAFTATAGDTALLFTVQSQGRYDVVSMGPPTLSPSALPTVLQAPWMAMWGGRNLASSIQHTCVAATAAVYGVISYEAVKQRSTFQIASGVTHSDAESTLLLEMVTPEFMESDEALIPSCGLAQRVVYLRCAVVHRADGFPSSSSPTFSNEQLRVMLVARVDGAISNSITGTGLLSWAPCGMQVYEAVAHRTKMNPQPLAQRQLTWSMGPFSRISSFSGAPSATSIHTVMREWGMPLRPLLCNKEELLDARQACAIETALLPWPWRPPEVHIGSPYCQQLRSVWWQGTRRVSHWTCTALQLTVSELTCLLLVTMLLVLLRNLFRLYNARA